MSITTPRHPLGDLRRQLLRGATASLGVAGLLTLALPLPAVGRPSLPAATATPVAMSTAAPGTTSVDFFYYTGTQGSWAVPGNISDLTVDLFGGAGAHDDSIRASGSGSMTIDLGTAFAGQTLHYLVGGNGKGSAASAGGSDNAGGGGTYLATEDELIAAVGGGGGSGSAAAGAITTATQGGSGGYVSISGAPVAGGTGATVSNPQAAGHGAVGSTAGEAGISSSGSPETTGSAGGSVTTVSEGVIHPSLGGYGADGAGGGGGGYAGGGGGSLYSANGTDEYGAGGGGSAYSVPGFPVKRGTSTGGLGGIVFHFRIDFSLRVSPMEVAAGSSLTAQIEGLERLNSFVLRLDSQTGPVLAMGRTDSLGSARITVAIPGGTPSGEHVLHLYENATEGGGGKQGDSNAFTVSQPVWRLHDFDGNGAPDVMARNPSGGLIMYTGDGAGGWQPPESIQVGSGWNGMTAMLAPGDFNGDGHPDILARDSTGNLWLYPGDGASGWSPRIRVGTRWNVMTSIIAPGDFNGDGTADVLAVNRAGDLILYPGDGKGGWLDAATIGFRWNVMTAVLGAGDFDGDGNPDLLARNAAGQLLSYGHEPAGWTSVTEVGSGWNVMSAVLSVGDFDGDGSTDVIARDSGGLLWLYPTDGQGGWNDRVQIGSGWNGMSWIG